MSKGLGYALLLGGLAIGAGCSSASAATLEVTNTSPCLTGHHATYSTIQAAVQAASMGDVVDVCPGSYPEQVTISNAITLAGVIVHAAGQTSYPIVTVPSGGVVANAASIDPNNLNFPIAAQILVEQGNLSSPPAVTVKNLTIDGTGNNDATCGVDLMGIYYQNASGNISGNTVENQLLPAGYQGCQDGQGIFVENLASPIGKVVIADNSVANFDKNGITVHLSSADAAITRNIVTGVGATPYIAQNGIEVAYDATATVTSNTVSNLVYSGGEYASSGILLFDLQPGPSGYKAPTAVSRNAVSSAQYGIALDAVSGKSGALMRVTGNVISGAQAAGVGLYTDDVSFASPVDDDYAYVAMNTIDNTNPYDGIDACSDHDTILENTVSSSTQSAIHLDSTCTEADTTASGYHNSVVSNRLAQACVGVLSGPPTAADNTIRGNIMVGVTNQFEYGADSFTCPAAQFRGTARFRSAQTHLRPVPHI